MSRSLFDDVPEDDDPPDRAEGERRRDDALDGHERTSPEVVYCGRVALLTILLERGTATMDDVRAVVPVPPGVNPKAFGAVPGPLAKRSIIRKDGSRNTARPKAHARPLTVWALADRVKALAFVNGGAL